VAPFHWLPHESRFRIVNTDFVIHATLCTRKTLPYSVGSKDQWWFVSLPVLWVSQHSLPQMSIQL
jgi:hypothetical protein